MNEGMVKHTITTENYIVLIKLRAWFAIPNRENFTMMYKNSYDKVQVFTFYSFETDYWSQRHIAKVAMALFLY
jgi:hypothetical protein